VLEELKKLSSRFILTEFLSNEKLEEKKQNDKKHEK
jgi:hypothetical protein